MSSEKNLVLIGMMGVGKSTVGRHLAVALKKDFFDSDREIERNSGASISWIFDVEGEAGFRKRESEAIANICLGENIVLATGGAVVREENRRILSDFGYVVFLSGSVELILSRTEHDKSRPLLQRSIEQKLSLAFCLNGLLLLRVGGSDLRCRPSRHRKNCE